jgi:hypothetical protein
MDRPGAVPTASVGLIDLNDPAPTYRAGAPMPGPGRQYLNLTNLFDRTTLASNGGTANRGGDVLYASIYNRDRDVESRHAADPVGRNYHSSTQLLPDGRVMVFGSNPLINSFEMRISIFEPPYLFKGTDRRSHRFPPHWRTAAASTSGSPVTFAAHRSPRLGSQTHQMDTNARLVELPMVGHRGRA